MTDTLSVLLTSFAVYSNFYAIITIVLSFMATAIFILRLNNGLPFYTRREEVPPNTAVERPIVCQSNPFYIELRDESQSNLKDGFLVHLSSLCHGNLTVLWGTEIEDVFNSMGQDAGTFLTDLEHGKYLQDKCLYSEHVKRLEGNTTEDIYIACPTQVQESDLGPAPRKRYSCVLIAAVTSSSTCYNTDIIASLAIIHLKDSLVRMGSHIMNQFVKTGDGRIYSLRSLYLSVNQEKSAPDRLNSKNKDDGLESNSSIQNKTRDSSSSILSEELGDITESNSCIISSDSMSDSLAESPISDITHSSSAQSWNLLENPENVEINVTNSSSFEKLSDVLKRSVDDPVAEVANSSSFDKLSDVLKNPVDDSLAKVSNSSSFEKLSDVLNRSIDDPVTDVTNSSSAEQLSSNVEELSSNVEEISSNVEEISSNVEEISSDVEDSSEMLEETDNMVSYSECVVCQSRPLSHVLLPCRHACVCRICLKLLTRCPMCRASIEAYFRLFNSVDDEVKVSEPPAPTDFISWVVHLNRKLNDYLGLGD